MNRYIYIQMGNFQPALLGNFQPVLTDGRLRAARRCLLHGEGAVGQRGGRGQVFVEGDDQRGAVRRRRCERGRGGVGGVGLGCALESDAERLATPSGSPHPPGVLEFVCVGDAPAGGTAGVLAVGGGGVEAQGLAAGGLDDHGVGRAGGEFGARWGGENEGSGGEAERGAERGVSSVREAACVDGPNGERGVVAFFVFGYDLDAGERVAGGVAPGGEALRSVASAARGVVVSLAEIADEGDGGLGGGGGGGQGGEHGEQGRGGEPEGFPVCRTRRACVWPTPWRDRPGLQAGPGVHSRKEDGEGAQRQSGWAKPRAGRRAQPRHGTPRRT